MKKNNTFAPNASKITKNWHLIDAKDEILGRLATEIAQLLIGKHKVEYAPNAELGDKVIVTNAKDIKVTGKKLDDKIYHHYTGYPGGIKSKTLGQLMKDQPTEAIKKAVFGMLPKNKLRKERIKNLFIYEGTEHPHTNLKNEK